MHFLKARRQPIFSVADSLSLISQSSSNEFQSLVASLCKEFSSEILFLCIEWSGDVSITTKEWMRSWLGKQKNEPKGKHKLRLENLIYAITGTRSFPPKIKIAGAKDNEQYMDDFENRLGILSSLGLTEKNHPSNKKILFVPTQNLMLLPKISSWEEFKKQLDSSLCR
jgi:hypothetical protein